MVDFYGQPISGIDMPSLKLRQAGGFDIGRGAGPSSEI